MTAVRALHDLSMDILGALEDGLDVEPGSALRWSTQKYTIKPLNPNTLNPKPYTRVSTPQKPHKV